MSDLELETPHDRAVEPRDDLAPAFGVFLSVILALLGWLVLLLMLRFH